MKSIKKNKEVIYKIIFLIIIFALPIVLIVNSSNPSIKVPQVNFPTSLDTIKEVEVEFISADTSGWKLGETYTVNVIFKNLENPQLSGAMLNFTHNPDVLKLTKIEQRDLWTEITELLNIIEDESGNSSLHIGRAPNARSTGSILIATLTFEVVGKGDTQINIAPSSGILFSDTSEASPLTASPLVVSISE